MTCTCYAFSKHYHCDLSLALAQALGLYTLSRDEKLKLDRLQKRRKRGAPGKNTNCYKRDPEKYLDTDILYPVETPVQISTTIEEANEANEDNVDEVVEDAPVPKRSVCSCKSCRGRCRCRISGGCSVGCSCPCLK